MKKPFRFQTMWLLRPEFPNVVKEAWLEDKPLTSAISEFTSKAMNWYINVFGNLFARKRIILAKLNGAQKA